MIQLVTDVVDRASAMQPDAPSDPSIRIPVDSVEQDLVFRNRGGEWLSSHERNEPTHPDRVKDGLALLRRAQKDYQLLGEYGEHLKSVVEAFVSAARNFFWDQCTRLRMARKPGKFPEWPFARRSLTSSA